MHPIETWLNARRDYVEGKGFLPDIARKYEIPVQTVQTRAKRERWSTARAEFIARKTRSPEVELPPAPPAPPQEPNDLEKKVHRLELQLARLDAMLDTLTDDRQLKNIAATHATLFEEWRVLKGVPAPGVRRHPKEKAHPVVVDVTPLE